MTEEQKKLVETFPKRDRGLRGSDDEEAPDLDPLDAAALKAKMQQKRMKEKRRERWE